MNNTHHTQYTFVLLYGIYPTNEENHNFVAIFICNVPSLTLFLFQLKSIVHIF